MKWRRLIWAVVVMATVVGWATSRRAVSRPAPPGGWPRPVYSDPVRYTVRMTTSFVVPEGMTGLDRVRVWHALPTLRVWSIPSDRMTSATAVRYSSGGKEQWDKAHQSFHVYWNVPGRLKPGAAQEYWSEYVVVSYRRSFPADATGVQWSDYDLPSPDPEARLDSEASRNVNGAVAEFADRIKAANGPVQAVRAICKWITENVKYDASVPYEPEDVAATLKNGRGHCGHAFAVFAQACARCGIPVRVVFGLNLYAVDGKGELDEVEPDLVNIHTWAEVYFPNVGWVEVEPSSEEPYEIPACYVQNNRWFENYAVWVRDKGKEKIPAWTYQGGKYVSEIGLKNVIQYREEKLTAATRPSRQPG